MKFLRIEVWDLKNPNMAERKLLKKLVEANTASKGGLAEACGMSASSGTFSNYLSSLTSKGLVIRTADGFYEPHLLLRG